jgi:hypothetical protein
MTCECVGAYGMMMIHAPILTNAPATTSVDRDLVLVYDLVIEYSGARPWLVLGRGGRIRVILVLMLMLVLGRWSGKVRVVVRVVVVRVWEDEVGIRRPSIIIGHNRRREGRGLLLYDSSSSSSSRWVVDGKGKCGTEKRSTPLRSLRLSEVWNGNASIGGARRVLKHSPPSHLPLFA